MPKSAEGRGSAGKRGSKLGEDGMDMALGASLSSSKGGRLDVRVLLEWESSLNLKIFENVI